MPKEAQTKQELQFRTSTLIPKEQTQHRFQGVGGRNKIKEEKSILFFCRLYHGNVGGSVNQRKKKFGPKIPQNKISDFEFLNQISAIYNLYNSSNFFKFQVHLFLI